MHGVILGHGLDYPSLFNASQSPISGHAAYKTSAWGHTHACTIRHAPLLARFTASIVGLPSYGHVCYQSSQTFSVLFLHFESTLTLSSSLYSTLILQLPLLLPQTFFHLTYSLRTIPRSFP